MATGSTSCFTNDPQAGRGPHMYGDADHQDVLSTRIESSTGLDSPSTSLLYNLSLLKDKLHQVQSLVGMYISPNHSQNTDQSTAIAKANMGTLLQEIIITASSMLFSCEQISIGATPSKTSITHKSLIDKLPYDGLSQPNHGETTLDWFGENYSYTTCYASMNDSEVSPILVDNSSKLSSMNNYYDIIEMDAAHLLAKYTHYCHICGKGFKRDANLRMHMRAHGDEYKSSAALSNPTKNNGAGGHGNGNELARKYSCPQEGCRWNRKHAKFQPLKSMICVKNHYKRCHCPKMYVCKRCNRKQFSVLSDLRTHEKHCGDLKWKCSCGTTFSRKDKLMGHVALFLGHFPAVNSFTAMSRKVKIGLDDR